MCAVGIAQYTHRAEVELQKQEGSDLAAVYIPAVTSHISNLK